uniref:Plus3 domain-containing protein n=1 Tax=Globodera rostochiensis TaxID=31243 RepID=A0A914IG74_GLORO
MSFAYGKSLQQKGPNGAALFWRRSALMFAGMVVGAVAVIKVFDPSRPYREGLELGKEELVEKYAEEYSALHEQLRQAEQQTEQPKRERVFLCAKFRPIHCFTELRSTSRHSDNMNLVQVKTEPEDLVIELWDNDNDSGEDDDPLVTFDLDEDANRSIMAMLRKRRSRRSTSISSQPRFGPLARSLSQDRFGPPPASASQLDPDDGAERVQTKGDLVRAMLTSVQLARLRKYLDFEQLLELAENAFVRVLSGAHKKIDRIVGILRCAEPYECDLLGIKFDMRFQMMWSGVCRLTQIASQPAEEALDTEFEQWKKEMERRRISFPTMTFVAEKCGELNAALEQLELAHSADSDYPVLRLRIDEEDNNLLPVGCFDDSDEEADEEGAGRVGTSAEEQNLLTNCAPKNVCAAPCVASANAPQRSAFPPLRSMLICPKTETSSDTVASAADVTDALLTRARLIDLYLSNTFEQFERVVIGCFVRVNTGQFEYKLDQLEMASESAAEQYTLKGTRQCRAILHLTLHGRRRINSVAFAAFKGKAQADTEFREWRALMAERHLNMPSLRFIDTKVAQLAAFSVGDKPSSSSSSSSSKRTFASPAQKPNFLSLPPPPPPAAVVAASDDEQQQEMDDDVLLANTDDNDYRLLTSSHLRPIALTSGDLVELLGLVESTAGRRALITGCFVRVFDHSVADGGTSVHRLHQIVDVQKGVHYRLRTAHVDTHLALRGEADLLRCDNVSNKAFTEDEFEEWADRTRNLEYPPPTKVFIDQKIEQLRRAKADPSSSSAQIVAIPPKTSDSRDSGRKEKKAAHQKSETAVVEEKRIKLPTRTISTLTRHPRPTSFICVGDFSGKTWREASAPAWHEEEKLSMSSSYAGYQPRGGRQGGRYSYGNAPASSSLSHRPRTISNTSSTEGWPSSSSRRLVLAIGDGSGSSDEEPMVARARQRVMDNMEPEGGGDDRFFGGAAPASPWNQLQPRPAAIVQRQQLPTDQQQTNTYFNQFEQSWYNNKGGSSRSHHYNKTAVHSSNQFFPPPTQCDAVRRHHRVSSPPVYTAGVPSAFYFSAKR